MDILLDTHIWYAISFVVFTVIVYRVGKDALLKLLDTRIENIRKEIQTAENLRVEAQELLAQYQRKQRDAMQEAEKITKNAQKQADDRRKHAEAELEKLIARREAQLKERLARMEQDAIDEIQAYATELAMDAAVRIINEKLDARTNEKLVDQSIKAVGDHIH